MFWFVFIGCRFSNSVSCKGRAHILRFIQISDGLDATDLNSFRCVAFNLLRHNGSSPGVLIFS